MSMLTYLFSVEIISFNPMAEEPTIDVDVDTYDIEASNEEEAVELLKEKFNYRGEHLVSGISKYQLLGCYDETFTPEEEAEIQKAFTLQERASLKQQFKELDKKDELPF